MKASKYSWTEVLSLKTQEERTKVWEEINYQKQLYRARMENAAVKPVLAAPYFILSSLYTLYLSCFVPFYGLESLSEIRYKVNISAFEPIVVWIKKISDGIGLAQPFSSIIGYVIFAVILPVVISFFINSYFSGKNEKVLLAALPEMGNTEKEQLVKILDSRKELSSINKKYHGKLFAGLLIAVSVFDTLIFFVGRTCEGAYKKVYSGDSVSAPLLIVGGFLLISIAVAIVFKAIFSDRGQYVPGTLFRSIDSAEERIAEIEAQEAWMAREAEWKFKFSTAVSLLKAEQYADAENAFFEIRAIYQNHEDIFDLYHVIGAVTEEGFSQELAEAVERGAHYDKDIDHVVKYIGDTETGFAIARFKKRNSLSLVSAAKVLGAISRNIVLVTDEYIETVAREINEKYSVSFRKKAIEEYAKGVEYFEDEDYENARKHLKLPALMGHEDAEALYAVACVPFESKNEFYRQIKRTIKNQHENIRCLSHKYSADKALDFIESESKVNVLSRQTEFPTASGKSSSVKSNSSGISDDDAAFMDWTIRQSKLERKYEALRAEGLSNYHPSGDADFPLDSETFPDSSQIW